MKTALFLLVALVALVVAAGVGFFFVKRASVDVAVPAADESAVQLQEKLDATESERARLDTELQAAQERIASLEAETVKAEDASAESTPSSEETSDTESADSEPDNLIREMDDEATMELIRAEIRENAQATMQVDAMTEMWYADFIASLGLEPDLAAEVKTMLRESVLEFIAVQAFAMETQDLTWAESAQWRNQNRALLSEQLQAILPPAAQAQWNAFAADIDARMLEGTLRSEIGMFARGLTPENLESVIQVGVEEFWGSQSAIEQTDALLSAVSSVEVRREAIHGMRERLGQILPEDQLAEIERYLTFADNALNAQQAQAERNAAERVERDENQPKDQKLAEVTGG